MLKTTAEPSPARQTVTLNKLPFRSRNRKKISYPQKQALQFCHIKKRKERREKQRKKKTDAVDRERENKTRNKERVKKGETQNGKGSRFGIFKLPNSVENHYRTWKKFRKIHKISIPNSVTHEIRYDNERSFRQ